MRLGKGPRLTPGDPFSREHAARDPFLVKPPLLGGKHLDALACVCPSLVFTASHPLPAPHLPHSWGFSAQPDPHGLFMTWPPPCPQPGSGLLAAARGWVDAGVVEDGAGRGMELRGPPGAWGQGSNCGWKRSGREGLKTRAADLKRGFWLPMPGGLDSPLTLGACGEGSFSQPLLWFALVLGLGSCPSSSGGNLHLSPQWLALCLWSV